MRRKSEGGSVRHLIFAVATTHYILIAQFGDQYRQYRERVGMLLPRNGRKIIERPAATPLKPH